MIMICPKCKHKLPADTMVCDNCGANLEVYEKLYRLSRAYYDQGLYAARSGNISLAKAMLVKSLEMDKSFIDARNLLGLCYFRTGAIVDAISQWVISKHFADEGNRAGFYMDNLQGNPTMLNDLDNAIKRYNKALSAARSGNDDTAILNLKRALSYNPDFVDALNLLALLYIKHKKKSRAERYLRHVLQLDAGNATALNYMKEVRRVTSDGRLEENKSKEIEEDASKSIEEFKKFKLDEDKPNVMAWLNLLIGAIIGMAVMFVLVIPTIEFGKTKDTAVEATIDYSTEIKVKDSMISSLEDKVELVEKQKEEAERKLKEMDDSKVDLTVYEDYFNALSEYLELQKMVEPSSKDYQTVAKKLTSVDLSKIEDKSAVKAFKSMQDNVLSMAAEPMFKEGKEELDDGNYDKAAELLQQSVDYGYITDRSLYNLAKAYQNLGKAKKAVKYFDMVVEKFPDSDLVDYAKGRADTLRDDAAGTGEGEDSDAEGTGEESGEESDEESAEN